MNVAASNLRVRRLVAFLASVSLLSSCASQMPGNVDPESEQMMASPGVVAGADVAAEESSTDDSSTDSDESHEGEHLATNQDGTAASNVATTDTGNNMVVADVERPGFFALKKTAPSEYVLTIEGAQIAPSANTGLVAPASSGLIRSVRPVADGNDVLLRIFAAPGSALTARQQNNKIIVSAASVADTDARAQAALPTETEAKPAADTEVAKPALDAAGVDSEVASLLAEQPKYTGRLISLDLQDTDIDNALRIIAEVSNLNIIASEDVTGKVTLRLIDVPWDQALDVILKTNGLDKVQEGNVIRIAPVEKLRQEREALKQAQQAEEELEPLTVRYIRVSYAKASELKALIDSVLSERGSVTYDERTNQLIVKDIRKGIRNVAELVAKLDLRTPQVLLETQIVEASRSLLRELGSQLGFQYLRTPETGNATGYNFPNSVEIGGGNGGYASSFPAAISGTAGSAVNFLFGSSDGTKNLETTISALEQEGRVRIVSRPAVATTNNKQAIIKSVEKIRVKTPSGGSTIQVGSGSNAGAGSGVATETIEVGITLTVTPQASPDYYVLLDVDAKSSTFGSQTVDGIPSEIERSANSTVLVSSGQTFAMGGIYKLTDRDTVDGVPFLKDVPFVGHLFRRTNTRKSDEELIFFITPRIVEGSFDDAAMKIAQ
jgi:type IV pilus assembly protein PilQ